MRLQIESKRHRQPFPKRAKSITTGLLELIQSEVCGPMDAPSVGESRYFVTFIDDFSRYITVYMIKQKYEVLAKFREFVNLVKSRTGLKVKLLSLENQTVNRLQLENGSECVSNNFNDFYNDRGIQHVETVRSMLHHAQKPLKFWVEAICSGCYIRNRNPTIFLKNVTPYEHWYGKKPEISNLKVFGCKSYAHVPDAKSKSNFDRKLIP